MENGYYSLSEYCKKTYGEKLYRIALDAGMTCPNRDGTLDSRGCIFCSAGGSGDFSARAADLITRGIISHDTDLRGLIPEGMAPGTGAVKDAAADHVTTDTAAEIASQIEQGKAQSAAKFHGSRYIAYFQAYTNTYDRPERLYRLYTQALSHPDVAGISIATRPDCLPENVLDVLSRCQAEYPDQFIWVELGLQTMHEQTARYLRRGYPLPVFAEAMEALHERRIPAIVHVIAGLPGETAAQFYETISYVNSFHPFGVKLQLLHVLRGTDLAADYERRRFDVLTQEQYIEMTAHALTLLSPDVVIHRLTGDGPKKLLIAPLWSADKKGVLNALHRYLREQQIVQGSRAAESSHTLL
ncbi:MAG: TIGR01212 family radical SAM protein [bacterium]|nr:TIGR01212 family radical SAM protein [bacterium]